ncbi:Scr1 family TA system antitoxin-like transcriptional regulator [Actinocorallia sp. B10E7]|uniref:Scr1 family TA system antitoxin-like transcriptional regulator n=1 Tax=Actinocorallia sp. B10E7 TaxID=3153558 RepID=UPI00325E4A82
MAARRKRGSVSPTLPAFGRQLRRHREAAGLSQESAGRRANGGRGVTSQYVGQVESGRTRCTREFASTMDAELKACGRLLELWDDLVLDSAFPTWFDWPNIEAEAVHITSYCLSVIDGLFQIPAYASAILRGDKDAVEARLRRQTILTRDDPPPPSYALLLDEATLVREVAGATTMREQLEHLLEASAEMSGRLTVQVVPARGEHDGNSGDKMDALSRTAWRKSSRSTSNGGACIELSTRPDTVLVRDSKNPDGTRLRFTSRGFQSLVRGIKES